MLGLFRERNFLPMQWNTSILILHSVGFYFFLLGYMYASEAQSRSGIRLANVSLVMLSIALTLRVVYSIVYLDHYPTEYSTS